MSGTSGISKARVRQGIRANVKPAPVEPTVLAPITGDSDVTFSAVGLNFTPDTGVAFISDAAAVDELANVTDVRIAPPSTLDGLGIIEVDVSFVNLPPATADLFQIFLTASNGQRVFLGVVNTA